MSLPQGIDFCATPTFVTHLTNCDPETATTANYPRTSAQGNSVGWLDAPDGVRDRNAGIDARLAGVAFGNVGAATYRYRIDLPSTGNYKFRIAAGDASGGNDVKVELFDNTTSKGVLVTSHSAVGGLRWYDATDTLYSDTTWPGSNSLTADINFASTICIFKFGPLVAGATVISHVWVEAGTASAGGGRILTASPLNGLGSGGSLFTNRLG